MQPGLTTLVLLPLAFGLLGFIEPCSIGSTLIVIKSLEGKRGCRRSAEKRRHDQLALPLAALRSSTSYFVVGGAAASPVSAAPKSSPAEFVGLSTAALGR